MDIDKAIKIISTLADGIDPYTGEIFTDDSPYQNPDTLRALFLAVKGMKKMESKDARSKVLPDNAGKPWSREEDQALIDQFRIEVSINELAEKHRRTKGAIRSRLVKLGQLSV